jgi:type I restriction enzyme M protein
MTSSSAPAAAFLAILTKTRGVLDVHEVIPAIIGLLALRMSLGESVTRSAGLHDVERVLDESIRRVTANQPDLADAVRALIAPARREPAALRDVLRSVDDIAGKAGQSELLVAMTSLLGELGKRSPGFVTGPNLLRLIVDLAITRKGARVCDPFCGAGLLLAASGVTLRPELRPAVLEGWERNVGSLALARAILAVLRVDVRLGVANALVAPPSADQYDAVVSAPPFGAQPPPQLHLGASARFTFGAPTRHADWLHVQHALSVLAPGGVAVMLMSRGPFFRGGAELDVRRGLIEANAIDAVVALPGGVLSGTSIPSCLLVLRRDRPAERSGAVLFIESAARSTTGADIPPGAVDDVVRAYERGVDADGPVRARRVLFDEIAAMEFSLDPARHLPSRVESVEESLDALVDELREVRSRREAAAARVASAFQHLLADQER